MVHRRSEIAYLRRKARKYIMDQSWRDREQAETISRTSTLDILEEFGECPFHVEKGLILADSRGRGSFQK